MVVPPAPTLTSGAPLLLRDGDGALLTETSGTTKATVTLYLRNRGEVNGQPVTIAPGDSLPVDGREVSAVALTGGAVSYALGTRHSPTVTPTPPTNTTNGVVVFGSNGGTPIVVNIDALGHLILSGTSVTRIGDPGNAAVFPVAFNSGVAHATGMWRGYAVATAPGEVKVQGILLGTATAAGQAFPLVIFVAYGDVAALTNCTVAGGGISL